MNKPSEGDPRLPQTAGVVFDLDGTLYTISGLGLHISLGMLTALRPLRPLFRVRAEMRDHDYGDLETFKQVFAEKLAEKSGLSPEQARNWYDNRFMVRFAAVLQKRGRVRPNLLPLLEGLRNRGVRLGVVSDFGGVPERLTALGIPLELFDDTEAAENFGVMKPTAVPFRRLAERWGIPTDRLLLVGDRVDHDQGCAQLLDVPFLGIENKKNFGASFYPWESVSRMLSAVGQPM